MSELGTRNLEGMNSSVVVVVVVVASTQEEIIFALASFFPSVYRLTQKVSRSPLLDSIRAMMIVRRIRGKALRTVLCCTCVLCAIVCTLI